MENKTMSDGTAIGGAIMDNKPMPNKKFSKYTFDASNEYNAEIKNTMDKLFNLCNKYNIPFAAVACYQSEATTGSNIAEGYIQCKIHNAASECIDRGNVLIKAIRDIISSDHQVFDIRTEPGNKPDETRYIFSLRQIK